MELFLQIPGVFTWFFLYDTDPVLLENSSDFAAATSVYTYDSDGRLTVDTGRGITNIGYSPAGKPLSITTADGTLSFAHYADGIRKQTIWTREVKGVTKKEFRTYEDAYEFSLRDVGNINNVHFLHMPWGYISSMDIHVYMQDYQGNKRAAVDQMRWAVQTTDYYPYGAPMATSTGASRNPYKYSGKEHETRMGLNQYDFHARNQLPTLGLFDQPDPKAGDYPWLNPYLYCAANPIANIDPTGEDVWRINTEGELVERIETTEYDMFQFIDSDGNVIQKDGVAQELEFEYGTVLESKELPYDEFTTKSGRKQESGSADIFTIRGDDNATQLFEMMAQNVTGVSGNEISLIRTGYEGDKGRNYISSGKRLGSEPGLSRLYQTQLVYGYNIRSMTHSHPISDYAGDTDQKFKNRITNYSTLLKVRRPKHFIYCVTQNHYIEF